MEMQSDAAQCLAGLLTEQRNAHSLGIAEMSTRDMLTCINREDQTVAQRVAEAIPQIAQAVERIVPRMRAGGRMVYVGAGTSGRIGYMDAAECGPTYGVAEDRIACVMAGGRPAVFAPQEMLEDSKEMAASDLAAWGLTGQDVVIAAAASGRTPYCLGALQYAQELGALRIALSCNEGSEMGQAAEIAIEVATGPEVIMGSTRMKAGTAQKLLMNMLSTAVMLRLGRTCDNLMIHIRARNRKASCRVLRLFAEATGNHDPKAAERRLEEAQGQLPVAALCEMTGQPVATVRAALDQTDGDFAAARARLE
ncbi:MAG: N-acetylmuramic acid 6-phosphate etherase [Clostridia bacterium]